MTRGRAEGDLFVQAEVSRDYWLMVDHCSNDSVPTAPSPPCVTYQGCQDGFVVTWCPHDGGHAPPSFAPAGIWNFIDGLR
jgi:hypothetical protein